MVNIHDNGEGNGVVIREQHPHANAVQNASDIKIRSSSTQSSCRSPASPSRFSSLSDSLSLAFKSASSLTKPPRLVVIALYPRARSSFEEMVKKGGWRVWVQMDPLQSSVLSIVKACDPLVYIQLDLRDLKVLSCLESGFQLIIQDSTTVDAMVCVG